MSALTLAESIELAKKNNKQFLADAEEVGKATNIYREVKSSILPQISLSGAVQATKTYLPQSTQTGFSFTDVTQDTGLAYTLDAILLPAKSTEEASIAAQLKATQLLYSGGQLLNGIKASKKYKDLQNKSFQLKEEQLVFDITKAYNELLLLNEVVEIQRAALALANEHYVRVQNMNENGLVSEYDLLRADLEVTRLSPALEDIENTYQIAVTNFKRLIGYNEDELLLEDKLKNIEVPAIELEEAINQGLSHRLELQLSELNVEMMEIQHTAYKGSYLPNILLTAEATAFTASGDYKVHKDEFGHLYQAGIAFQMPIFTGFSNDAKIKQAKHDLKKSKLNKMNTEDLISIEITNNWNSMETAKQQLSVQEKNILTAEKGYQIANERYQNNIGIQLEILDAQTQLNAAKVSYIQALHQLNLAVNSFKKSIGIKL